MDGSGLIKSQTEIGEITEPWEGDHLGRKEVADYLTPVINGISQPMVLGINGAYGTGKSFLLRHWQADLKQQGYKTAYFNAWETDLGGDIIPTFLVNVIEQVVDGEDKANKLEKMLDNLSATASALVNPKVLNIAAEAVAKKVVGKDAVKDFKELQTGIKQAIEPATSVSFSRAKSQQKALKNFRKALEGSVKDVLKGVVGDEKQKLIIFVDELDRCRPTYAIELLEAIKHLFGVENTLFILGYDEQQLHSTIRSVYGQGLDADGYLRRFVEWRFELPKPAPGQYWEKLKQSFSADFLAKHESDMNRVGLGFSALAYGFGLSLREQEQVFTHLKLMLLHDPYLTNEADEYIIAIGFLSSLYVTRKEYYDKYLSGSVNFFEAVFDLYSQMKLIDSSKTRIGRHFFKNIPGYLLLWLLNADRRDGILEEYNQVKDLDDDKAIFIKQAFDSATELNPAVNNESIAQKVHRHITGAAKYLAQD